MQICGKIIAFVIEKRAIQGRIKNPVEDLWWNLLTVLLKTVFHKFCLVHPWTLVFYYLPKLLKFKSETSHFLFCYPGFSGCLFCFLDIYFKFRLRSTSSLTVWVSSRWICSFKWSRFSLIIVLSPLLLSTKDRAFPVLSYIYIVLFFSF